MVKEKLSKRNSLLVLELALNVCRRWYVPLGQYSA
jgi:hypothetical protein